jgi:hypothetical protein
MRRQTFNNTKISCRPRLSQIYTSELTKKILILLDVPPECEKNIRVINTFNVIRKEYIMLHYCDPNPYVYDVRGTIIEINELKIVCRSFPFTPEFDVANKYCKWEINLIMDELNQYRSTKTGEGTILRLWNDEGKDEWIISTHTKIDGRRCKWSGDEFGSMFDKLWQKEDYSVLEKNKTYVFLLSHKGNRISSINNRLTYLGCSKALPGGKYSTVNDFTALPLKSPVIFQTELNLSEKEIMENLSQNKQCTGFLFQHKVTGKCTKLINSQYFQGRCKTYRGSGIDVSRRYVYLLLEDNKTNIDDFKDMHKEEFSSLDKIEVQLNAIPKIMLDWYNCRYVQKNFLQLTQNAHNLIKKSKEHIENNAVPREDAHLIEVFKRIMKECPVDTYNTLARYEKTINAVIS